MAISDRIIFSKTFGSGKANGADVNGHGTHVAGIIASSDILPILALAPRCKYNSLKST